MQNLRGSRQATFGGRRGRGPPVQVPVRIPRGAERARRDLHPQAPRRGRVGFAPWELVHPRPGLEAGVRLPECRGHHDRLGEIRVVGARAGRYC
eukprot:5922616-Pyramimonas_sp.AAC.1